MLRPMMRRWFGVGVLGCAALVGCEHSQSYTAHSSAHNYSQVTTLPSYSNGTSYVGAPVQPAMTAPVQQVVTQPMPTAPVVIPVAAEHPVEAVQVAPPPPPPISHETVPAAYTSTTAPVVKEDETVKRRSFADITANPAFSHADDYSWMIGELQFVHVRNVWKVRYASVDEEDRYGGSVTIIEMGPMTKYAEGQMVKVEGQLVNPESREPSPEYRVKNIQVINP